MNNVADAFPLNAMPEILESRRETIGEMFFEGDKPLLKMWNVTVLGGMRRQVKHSHSRFEINIVRSGSGEYSTATAAYPIRAGDFYIFSSNEQHCITEVSSSELCITVLHFEPRYLIGSLNGHNADLAGFCFSHSHDFSNRIRGEAAPDLRHCFFSVQSELKERKIGCEAAIKAYLELMLTDLLRSFDYITPQSDLSRPSVLSMLKVYNYIDEHLSEHLTLEELSGVAGLSPNYFSHIFKKMNDISLWDYITAKRVEKAIALITSGADEQTMLDTALSCGFNSTVNFNKAFKKHKGITPSGLKKNPGLLLH